jgi:S1-C subfamily serine protease
MRIKVVKQNVTASGFSLQIDELKDYLFLITNKHVIANADSINVTVSVLDSECYIIDTLIFELPLYDDKGDSLFSIPNDDFDLACLIVPKSNFSRPGKELHFSSLDTSLFVSNNEIMVGSDVLFWGFPMGYYANLNSGLIRKAIVSGIDTLREIIYLDANTYGGSSGSPVYLDFNDHRNSAIISQGKFLIGVIARTFPSFIYERDSLNLSWVQTAKYAESGNLALVIPPLALKDLYEKSKDKLLNRIRK